MEGRLAVRRHLFIWGGIFIYLVGCAALLTPSIRASDDPMLVVHLKVKFDENHIPRELIQAVDRTVTKNGRFARHIGKYHLEPAAYNPTTDPGWKKPLHELPRGPRDYDSSREFQAMMQAVGERGTGELNVVFSPADDNTTLVIGMVEGRVPGDGPAQWQPMVMVLPSGSRSVPPAPPSD